MCIGFSSPVKSNNENSDRDNLLNCSAYHLKAKLYYQYFDKKKIQIS